MTFGYLGKLPLLELNMMSQETIQRCMDAMTREVLEPALGELEAEAGQRIRVELRVASPATTARISRDQVENATATGEIRIALKESFGGAIRFGCQAVIRGLAPSTGFSGFSMEGKIELDLGEVKVHLKGRTNHYNQWEWRPDFAIA
jgi:hypothetical protein